ncbi:acyl-CoA thioesterase [Noviherbaspirillum pedocola]|uniref:Acyl-CoA thioesterase n=1 Tax=Noviherbaspirillum pedocola TaxID=2801341 RepID=A0A934SZC2_9BURK|nr:acyl-CoA thioesterase [Noviherbaspirillum pedocola]MBK4738487.1 acyl-CoA thioesterase [Noviherbaspirillum pedocola]
MNSHAQPSRQRPREVTLRFLAEPTDVNFGGKVHGGAVMKWIDQAGYACAVGWSGYYCVTVYVGGIRFHKPIFIGQIVEVNAKVIHTGTSSMHITIDVSATDPRTGGRKTTTSCLIVFVAVDGGGDTVPVPSWLPETEEDKRLEQHAKQMAKVRKEQDEEMLIAASVEQ